MFEVKKANKELLDGLQKKEKAKKARTWKVVYGILKILGILGTGAALVSFGVTGAIIATVCSTFVLSFAWVSKVCAKEALDSENDKKVELAVELASQLGVEVDPKRLQPELVATLDETKEATFDQDGEEITYGYVGQKIGYYKYIDNAGDNHLLKGTMTYSDDKALLPFGGGYTNRIINSFEVNGLEESDLEALPREVVAQIADYEATQQQGNKPYTKSRKRSQINR